MTLKIKKYLSLGEREYVRLVKLNSPSLSHRTVQTASRTSSVQRSPLLSHRTAQPASQTSSEQRSPLLSRQTVLPASQTSSVQRSPIILHRTALPASQTPPIQRSPLLSQRTVQSANQTPPIRRSPLLSQCAQPPSPAGDKSPVINGSPLNYLKSSSTGDSAPGFQRPLPPAPSDHQLVVPELHGSPCRHHHQPAGQLYCHRHAPLYQVYIM